MQPHRGLASLEAGSRASGGRVGEIGMKTDDKGQGTGGGWLSRTGSYLGTLRG